MTTKTTTAVAGSMAMVGNTTTTTTGSMTDMEPKNPGPLLRHIREQNAHMREQIAAKVADMNQTDLKAVLRMIQVWLGQKP